MASDPLTVTAGSVAAGVSAITLAALGLEPQTILYAALGSALGIVGTSPMSWPRTVAVFVACVLIGALASTVAARHWMGGDPELRNLLAAVAAPLWPLARQHIVAHVPAIVARVLARLTGGPTRDS